MDEIAVTSGKGEGTKEDETNTVEKHVLNERGLIQEMQGDARLCFSSGKTMLDDREYSYYFKQR